MNYASFGVRFVAKIIDLIIITVIGYGSVAILTNAFKSAPLSVQQTIALSIYLFQIGYVAGFLERFGATPGKMLLGLKVVQANGEPLTSGRAFGRAFAEMLTGMTCYIGYLISLSDPEVRTLHDRLCETRVVYK